MALAIAARVVRARSLFNDPDLEDDMRALLGISILALPIVSPPRHTPPEACYVAAIAVIVDDVKDPKDIKYHRMVLTGIRKLAPAPHALPESCDPRDNVVPSVLQSAAEARVYEVGLSPGQVRHAYLLRHASLDAIQTDIKRYATAARRYSGSFTRIETVLVDTPDAPRSAEIPLPRLTTTDAEAASCGAENKTLERERATYRWAC